MATLITIWSFIMKYKTFIVIAIIAGLGYLSYHFYNNMVEAKNDYKRQTENVKNMNQELVVERSKSDKAIYSVNTLQMTVDELQKTLPAIKDELKDMNIKLKNVQSYSKVEYKVNTVYDTIKTPEKPIVFENIKGKELQYKFFSDKDSTLIKGMINVPIKNELNYGFYGINELAQPYLSGVTFDFNGTLNIVNEIQYKRSWIFWKKPIGVKIHIKSNSDVFKIDQIQSIQLVK